MKHKQIIFTVFAILAFSLSMQAQILNPVKWTKAVKWTDEHNGVITFTATIDNGWHMYSNDSPDDGPTPLSVKFKNTNGVKLVGGLTTKLVPLPLPSRSVSQAKSMSHKFRKTTMKRKPMTKTLKTLKRISRK